MRSFSPQVQAALRRALKVGFDTVELMMAFDDRFGVKFPDAVNTVRERSDRMLHNFSL